MFTRRMLIIRNLKCYFFILAIFSVLTQKTSGQKLVLEEYKSKYPGESKVMLNMKTEYQINQVGDSINMLIHKHEEEYCVGENSIMEAKESISFSGVFQIKKLEAQTLVPVKSKFKAIKVTDFDTSDYRSPSIFEDDVKKISFKFPKLQPGAKTELDYSYNLTEPRFATPVYFNYYMPVESAEVSVTFPDNVEIGYKLFNCDTLKIDFSQEKKGALNVYRWKLKNVPLIKSEDNAPELAYYGSHLYVYVKSYTINGKKRQLGSSVDDLFNWYQTFMAHLNKQPAPHLKQLVDSLTYGLNDTTEKVKKLFFWVQDNIKYIAFEAGNDGFIPRDAELIYTRRFGDCKDMASLTCHMLNLAGIPGHMVWIGTRHIPYSYYTLPLPAVDNHMIAAYKSNNKWIFLDGTTGPHPFGYPSDMIQGKEALIYLGPGKYEISRVPVMEPEANQIIDSLFIKIEGKKIIGKGVSYFKGFSRYDMYYRISQKDKITQNTILKNYFEKGNNKFLIDNFDIKNLEDRDKDLIISYNFNLDDYAQVVGNEIFINLNMKKSLQGDLIKDTRKIPIEADYKKTEINNVILQLPQDVKVNYLPGNVEYQNPSFDFNVKYKQEKQKIIMTHTYSLNFLLLPQTEFANWNQLLTKAKEAYKESINLIKTTDK
jgi:transglutaminase-like putative cysteine protease